MSALDDVIGQVEASYLGQTEAEFRACLEVAGRASAELARLREAGELVEYMRANKEGKNGVSVNTGRAEMFMATDGDWRVFDAVGLIQYRGPSLSAALAALKGEQ